MNNAFFGPDTFLIINEAKLKKLGFNYFLYNKNHGELHYQLDPSGIVNYRFAAYGDTLFLDHFTSNKWVTIDTLLSDTNNLIQIADYKLPQHHGENRYRMRLTGSKRARYLKRFEIVSTKEKVELLTHKVTDSLHFSAPVSYELVRSLWHQNRHGLWKVYGLFEFRGIYLFYKF